eukprot:SAG31_NODE_26305_length_444_cov_1.408696_1_plen_74_part_01
MSDSGELEETQLTDECGSVLRWILRDQQANSQSSSDDTDLINLEGDGSDGEQEHDHRLARELDAVVNWSENLEN